MQRGLSDIYLIDYICLGHESHQLHVSLSWTLHFLDHFSFWGIILKTGHKSDEGFFTLAFSIFIWLRSLVVIVVGDVWDLSFCQHGLSKGFWDSILKTSFKPRSFLFSNSWALILEIVRRVAFRARPLLSSLKLRSLSFLFNFLGRLSFASGFLLFLYELCHLLFTLLHRSVCNFVRGGCCGRLICGFRLARSEILLYE